MLYVQYKNVKRQKAKNQRKQSLQQSVKCKFNVVLIRSKATNTRMAHDSQNRACLHGTSAKPARGGMRHTSHCSRQRLMLIPTPLKSSLLA